MILQDTLHAHHDFGQVDWDNALNVNSAYQQGSITIRVQTTKRSYEFSQYLTADRARFISEERVALQLNRDLSIDEQIEHYKTQGELAYSKRYYDKAVKEFLRLEDVFLKENKQQDERLTNAYWVINSAYFYIKNYEKSIEYSNKYIKSQDLKGRGNIKLAVSYHRMGICLLILKESSTAIKAFHDALDIIDVQPVIDVKTQSSTLFNLGLSYLQNKDKNNAKNYFERVLRALEPQPSINTTLLVKTYQQLRKCYGSDQKKIRYYTQLIAQYQDTIIEPSQDVNEPSLSDDNVDVSQFNDYLEVWTPIVLQYTAKSLRIDNYKNTSPIAFDIPMTTNFDLISDVLDKNNLFTRKSIWYLDNFINA